MNEFKIDYQFGIATLYTPIEDWEERFYELAYQCFGIRKSIGDVKLLSRKRSSMPLDYGGYERLEHNGDIIVWDEHGNKIKDEWS